MAEAMIASKTKGMSFIRRRRVGGDSGGRHDGERMEEGGVVECFCTTGSEASEVLRRTTRDRLTAPQRAANRLALRRVSRSI